MNNTFLSDPSSKAIITKEELIAWGNLRREATRNGVYANIRNITQNYPGFVPLIDYFVNQEGNTILTYELIDNPKDLYEILTENDSLNIQELTVLIQLLCTPIKVLHQFGLIHRDIHIKNYMAENGDKDKIKPADFETTRRFGALNNDYGEIPVASEGFSPPEQYFTDSTIHQTFDINALGITIAVLINKYIYIDVINRDKLVKLTRKNFGDKLAEIISKATEENPSKRYQSAEELENDIITTLSTLQTTEA